MSVQICPTRSTTNPFRISVIRACLIAAGIAAQPVIAADNPGAHEHGSARLQMALEANRIDLIFNSPAYNLAGFEHEARTEEEKTRLATVRSWLETNPLVNTAADDCKVTTATVELEGSSDDHDHHDHHHHHDEHHHGDGHGKKATHRDYEVSQQLECSGEASSQAFSSPLMGRFPELQELTIEWVGSSGQGSFRMTSSGQTFSPGD